MRVLVSCLVVVLAVSCARERDGGKDQDAGVIAQTPDASAVDAAVTPDSGQEPDAGQTADAGPPLDEHEGLFPPDFRWGTAVAGFQVEAGCPTLPASECEDPNSDWYQFAMSAEMRKELGNFLSGDDVSKAPGFYETYEQDLDRAHNDLHNNAFRFSMEWSRIFPTSTRGITGYDALKQVANPAGIAYYHRVLDAALQRGLQPLVTLNHYSLPLWIHDGVSCHEKLEECTARGWLDADTGEELAKYSGFVAKEYGSKVDWWATQNEPMAIVLAGYLAPQAVRSNPPALKMKLDEARVVMGALQVAHARQYDAVKANDTVDADGDGHASRVGLVFAVSGVGPHDPTDEGDVLAAGDVNYLYNNAFLSGVIRGEFDPDLDGVPEYRADMANRMDYLGINYYMAITVKGSLLKKPMFPSLSPLTRFDPTSVRWNMDAPKGIHDVCMEARRWNIPLIITENGIPDPEDDGTSTRFMVTHLTWLSRAIREGAPVLGYFWWTLMDNYEWNHGMDVRMGLYAVDGTDPQKTRVARKSVETYGRIAGGNAIPRDLLLANPVP